MVTYVRDNTGRFSQRPHYKPEEIDRECEEIISNFLKELYGQVRFPIETDDITKLIERDAEDLDLYADLSSYGADVEGVTIFRKGRKPSVLISTELTNDERRQNRLRTTLTHEYGHVHFHSFLWEMESPKKLDFFGNKVNSNKVICKRDSIVDAAQTDWMEWQAGYVCGAILMPKSAMRQLYQEFVEEQNIYGAVSMQTIHSADLVDRVVETFQVSGDAAHVRLLKLGFLTGASPTMSLFN